MANNFIEKLVNLNWLESAILNWSDSVCQNPLMALVNIFIFLFIFLIILYIYSLFKKEKNLKIIVRNRAISIFLAGVLSFIGLFLASCFLKDTNQTNLSFLSLFIPFITSPVLLVLWLCRDANQRDTIENQRKDTNLKDFQQLQQWATGNFNYDDIVDEKIINKELNWNSSKRAEQVEQNRLTLQTSALHQLRPFLQGNYGDSFKRATFEIYAALLKQTHQTILKKADLSLESYQFRNQLSGLISENRLAFTLKRIVEEEKEFFFNQDFPYQGISLVGMNLSKFKFKKIKGKEVNFSQANFIGAYLEGAHLKEVNLREAHLERADLIGAHLERAYLEGAHLERAYLEGAHLEEVNLREAHLERADLIGAHLERANLSNAHLERANLKWAHLERAYLEGAHLKEVNLREAHLERADLIDAHLERANLIDAHLERADLSLAHLEATDLRGAHLEAANLSRAHLEAADLSDTHLEGADFSRAHLEGTYSDERNYSSFKETIEKQTNQETNLTGISQEKLSEQRAEKIIQIIEKQRDDWNEEEINQRIERVKNAIGKSGIEAIDLNKAKIGSYDKKKAEEIIKRYDEAMARVK